MRHILIKSVIGSSLLVLGMSGQARAQRYPYEDRPYSDDFHSNQTFFHQVRADLDRAENNSYSDHSLFDRVRGELSELQRQWDENEYSVDQAGKVISALQMVLREDELMLRDRDRLSEDLRQLRDFVATHE